MLVPSLEGKDTAWQNRLIDLSAEAFVESFLNEFRFESDEIDNFAGCYVDDVVVSSPET